jgi:Paraquat-inducible protein A
LVILVVVGCVMPSFTLDIHGLVGVAVESGQKFEDATTYHSVFTVAQLLMEEARFLDTPSDYLGLGTLSVLFVLTVLVVPVLQSLALMRQWFSALTLEERSRMSIAIEVLQAWQYAEVYLISIFVASWQLGPVSEFMINSYCESLGDFFAQMVYFGFLKEEDAQCFSVQSSIEDGTFILAAGTVLLALLNTFVTKAVSQYLREKAQLEKKIEDELSTYEMDEEEQASQEDKATPSRESRVHPVPVLFTDTFRWLLRGDGKETLSSRAFEAQFVVPMSASKKVCVVEDEDALESVPSFVNAASSDDGMLVASSDDDGRGLTTVSLDEESSSISKGEGCRIQMGYEGRNSLPRQNVGRLLSQSINNRPDKGDDGAL